MEIYRLYNEYMAIDDRGYVNADTLSNLLSEPIFKFLKNEDTIETMENITALTFVDKFIYKRESIYSNINGWYIHSFLALELAAIFSDSSFCVGHTFFSCFLEHILSVYSSLLAFFPFFPAIQYNCPSKHCFHRYLWSTTA